MTTAYPETVPIAPALAELAFASSSDSEVSRSLAWSSPGLELDLNNATQRRFGDYELLELIGQGGMGSVYRARQHNLDREVALKFLAAGPWASDEFIARFRREAQAAARMQHPNIVDIYDTGVRDGLYYFSMRLVKGETLSERLRGKGPMGVKQAAKMMRTIAEAIDYAHRLGVLHLDLKPGNVLLGENNEPLIADFGLARRIDEGPYADHEEVCGTPSYMAPEQATSRSTGIGPAADIYGLGAILYEMLLGEPPFRGRDVRETLQHVVNVEPVAPKSRRHDIPADLQAICLKCLAKDPAQRYASARELADDLGRFVDGHTVVARPLNAAQRIASWIRREPRLAGMAGAVLLTLTSGIAATSAQWQRAEHALDLAELRRVESDELREAAESRSTELERISELVIGTVLGDDLLDEEAIAGRANATVHRLDEMARGDPKVIASILKRLVVVLDTRLGPEAAQAFLQPILDIYGAQFRAEIAAAWHERESADAALIAALWSRPGNTRLREHHRGDIDSSARRSATFVEAIQAAVEREPDSLMVRFVDTLFCTTSAEACSDSDSPKRLLTISPDNAAHYVLVAHFAKSEIEVRALLRKAASAPNYDDHFAALFELYLRGVRESGLEIPEVLGGPIRSTTSQDSPSFLISFVEFQIRPVFDLGPFRTLCASTTATADFPLRRDCISFFEKAFASRGGLLHRRVGETMLRRLLDDPHRLAELVEDRRRYLWMLECPGVTEVTPGERNVGWEQFMTDAARHGELHAFFLRAKNLGCDAEPPESWTPKDPERLLLPELAGGR